MKNLIGLTLALALVLSVAPVMAEDSFEGMESLNSAVAALPDSELAQVEGGQTTVEFCLICVPIATVTQVNLAVTTAVAAGIGNVAAAVTSQENSAAINQPVNSGFTTFTAVQ